MLLSLIHCSKLRLSALPFGFAFQTTLLDFHINTLCRMLSAEKEFSEIASRLKLLLRAAQAMFVPDGVRSVAAVHVVFRNSRAFFAVDWKRVAERARNHAPWCWMRVK